MHFNLENNEKFREFTIKYWQLFYKLVLLLRGILHFFYYHNFGIILNDHLITDLRSFKLSMLTIIKGGIIFLTILFKIDNWFKG
jgi:hypothetical protein